MEMLIAIGIFTIGMAGFTVLFARSWITNHFILEEGQASLVASRAVEGLVSDLRRIRQADSGEYPILSCDDFDLVVFIDIDGDDVTEKVHYFIDDEELKRGISNPSGVPPVYPDEDEEVETLTNYVYNSGIQPAFYYYNHEYPGDAEHNPMDTPVADIEDVRLVKIHLLINIDPGRTPENVNIESFAELRNLNDYQ